MRPRDLMVDGSQFGRSIDAAWTNRGTDEERASARLQHECSIEMRRGAKSVYGSLRRYCDETGQSYQRLGQVVRGDRTMRFDDVGSAVAHLGLSVRFASRFSDLDGTAVAGKTEQRDSTGAFYTPDVVADYMVARLGICTNDAVLEPCFGDGAFLSALMRASIGPDSITGVEIDAAACSLARRMGLLSKRGTIQTDFLDISAKAGYDVVVGNPPYVRIRAVDADERAKALALSAQHKDVSFGEDASLWVPFVTLCIDHLRAGGRLALVLPYELTYVRYARSLWRYLGKSFGRIEVVRIHDRIFSDLMQDVVLLFCYERGGNCEEVTYRCYESMDDAREENPVVDGAVSVSEVAEGKRAFMTAMVPDELSDALGAATDGVLRSASETAFHIGYVCGNKGFFHPSDDVVAMFDLPSSSLMPTAVSSRRLAGCALRTSASDVSDVLWLPKGDLSEGESRYVTYGESINVNAGYKCRIRDPWWLVPMVRIPDVIMSVFSDTPRLMLNDGGWTFSNSLLGANMAKNVDSAAFVETWYTVLTLLSVELEVHALGGGVLVAVPNEANNVVKLSSKHATNEPARLAAISDALVSGNLDEAYRVGDDILAAVFGERFVCQCWDAVSLLRSWRRC